MMGITTILGLITGAIDVIGAFKGPAWQAKTAPDIQTAVGVISALTPLVQSFGNGNEVTLEDARVALAGKDTALAALDKAIADARP